MVEGSTNRWPDKIKVYDLNGLYHLLTLYSTQGLHDGGLQMVESQPGRVTTAHKLHRLPCVHLLVGPLHPLTNSVSLPKGKRIGLKKCITM